MNVTLIIVTKDRPEEVAVSLQSAAEQTVSWQQVIVVDGGEMDAMKLVPHAVKEKLPLEVYASAPGIARQRNLARQHVNPDCDIVVYIDDDTYLEPNVCRGIQNFISNYPDMVGLTGHINGEKPVSRFKRIVGVFTQIYTARPYGISRGIFNNINVSNSREKIDWLPGAFMVYNWKLVKDLEFDEWFNGYGLGEDLDFSLRAAERGGLFIDPEIRVTHYHSPRGRNWRTFGYMRIVNRRYILDKFFSNQAGYTFGYWWSNFWLMLLSAMRVPFGMRHLQQHIGYWQGIGAVLFNGAGRHHDIYHEKHHKTA